MLDAGNPLRVLCLLLHSEVLRDTEGYCAHWQPTAFAYLAHNSVCPPTRKVFVKNISRCLDPNSTGSWPLIAYSQYRLIINAVHTA